MKIFLARHGMSNSADVDPEQSLSPQGLSDLEAIAKFIAHHAPPLDLILHSPKKKAKQTAEIWARYLEPKCTMESHDYLTPNAEIDEALGRIELEEAGNVMIVSHLPFLSRLCSQLVAGNEDTQVARFHSGTICCVDGDDGQWSIEWIVGKNLL